MDIKRTNKEIIIRIPSSVDITGLQEVINYLIYKEATSGSKAKQKDVDTLSKSINKNWWKENRDRLIK